MDLITKMTVVKMMLKLKEKHPGIYSKLFNEVKEEMLKEFKDENVLNKN